MEQSIAEQFNGDFVVVQQSEDCPRTLAIYRPGIRIHGVTHHFSWSGNMPMTGTLRCYLCGQEKHA
jgi:hypothetical protein